MWHRKQFIEEMDNLIRPTLEIITNSKLDSDKWILSSLPINIGGLGVRRVQDIHLPAFLSSINSTSPLVCFMLKMSSQNILEIADYENGLNTWTSMHPRTSQPEKPSIQKHWDLINTTHLFNNIHFETDDDKARILAICNSESGAWMHALPSSSIGTLLDNNSFRIIIGLRLGMDICITHTCRCGSQVDKKGHHGLKCRKL